MSWTTEFDFDSDNEEDDDEDELLVTLVAALYLLLLVDCNLLARRAAKWQHTRLSWEWHVVQLRHENLFERMYRMSYDAFVTFKRVLGDGIVLNADRAPGVMPIPSDCDGYWIAIDVRVPES
jgi:hypothetical protein